MPYNSIVRFKDTDIVITYCSPYCYCYYYHDQKPPLVTQQISFRILLFRAVVRIEFLLQFTSGLNFSGNLKHFSVKMPFGRSFCLPMSLSSLLLLLLSSRFALVFSQTCNTRFCLIPHETNETLTSLKDAKESCKTKDKDSFPLEIYDEQLNELLLSTLSNNTNFWKHHVLLNIVERTSKEWYYIDEVTSWFHSFYHYLTSICILICKICLLTHSLGMVLIGNLILLIIYLY